MAIQTLGKGIYVVKADKPATNATNYVELISKAKDKQLELSLAAANSEFASKKLAYDQKMALYQQQLQSLQARKKQLEDAKIAQITDIQKINAQGRREYGLARGKAAVDIAGKQAEVMGINNPTVRVTQTGPTSGAGGKEAKTTEDQKKIVRGFASGAGVSQNVAGHVLDKFAASLASGGAFAATSDAQRKALLGETVQQAINFYIGQGMTDSQASTLVSQELSQLGDRGREALSVYNQFVTPEKPETEVTRSGGESLVRKYQGLEMPAGAFEYQPVEADTSTIDEQLKKLEQELGALELPEELKFDLFRRAREIQSQTFMQTPYEKRKARKAAEEAATTQAKAQVPTFSKEDMDKAMEQTPEGYITLRAENLQKLSKEPGAIDALLQSPLGSELSKLFNANLSTGALEESAKKTWDEISKMYSGKPDEMRTAHTLVMALTDRERAKKNPAKAMELSMLEDKEEPVTTQPEKPKSDIETAGAAIVMPPPVMQDMPGVRPIPK